MPDLPAIRPNAAIDLVMQMMAIPGKSREEGRIAEFIRSRLVEAGVPAKAIQHDSANKRSPAGGEVGNLIVKLPGSQRAPRRLLMAHIDTVPLCVGAKPVRRGSMIESADPETALGGDDRGGAAVILNAILEILRQGLPHPPLTLFWPVQEEIGLCGARYVNPKQLGGPRLCFNWDGAAPNVAVVGATGDYNIEIEIQGRASHAGVHPEQGVNAIAIASLAIADLVENGWHGLIVKGRTTGTSNVGVIAGGDATNVVTPRVRLRAEARSHDPKFRKRIVDAIQKAFEKAAKAIKSDTGATGRITFTSDLKYESFRLAKDNPSLQTAIRAIEAAGLEPDQRISNGGLDANWMTAHGLPTITLGCGQAAIHTTSETLHVDSFLHACRIGLILATGTI